jgi:hypothetical protein
VGIMEEEKMEDLYYTAEKLAWDLKGKIYSDNGKFIVYLNGRTFEFSNIKGVVKFLEFTKKEMERHVKN